MSKFKSWGDYTYPRTDVLRNKHGVREQRKLRDLEEELASLALADMFERNPVEGSFDREHMNAIHRRIFGDTYEWAGQERVGPPFPQRMVKTGPSPNSIAKGDYTAEDRYPYAYFPAGEAMADYFDEHVNRLRSQDDLGAETPSSFAEKIAGPWGELNVAHIFREGNTRSQVAFFTLFAREHDHDLDHERFASDALFRAKFNAGRFLIQANQGTELFTEMLSEAFSGASGASFNPLSTGDLIAEDYDDYTPSYASDEVPHPRPQESDGSKRSPSLAQGTPPDQCGALTTKGHPCTKSLNCPHHRGGKP